MSPRQTPPAADADANRHRSPSPYTPYLVTYNPNAAHLQSKRSRSPIVPSSSLSSQTTSPIMTNIQPLALSGQPPSSLSRAHSHSHSRSFSQIHQHSSQSLAHLDAGPSSHRMSSLYSLRSPSQTPTSCQQDTVVMTDKVELLFRNDTRGPIINQYAIGPKLGGGQHGEVFKGYDITKDNMVVVRNLILIHPYCHSCFLPATPPSLSPFSCYFLHSGYSLCFSFDSETIGHQSL